MTTVVDQATEVIDRDFTPEAIAERKSHYADNYLGMFTTITTALEEKKLPKFLRQTPGRDGHHNACIHVWTCYQVAEVIIGFLRLDDALGTLVVDKNGDYDTATVLNTFDLEWVEQASHLDLQALFKPQSPL